MAVAMQNAVFLQIHRPVLCAVYLDLAVLRLVLLDRVPNQDQNLTVRASSFVVGNHVQFVQHLFVNADG